jgi:hypothetical protein
MCFPRALSRAERTCAARPGGSGISNRRDYSTHSRRPMLIGFPWERRFRLRITFRRLQRTTGISRHEILKDSAACEGPWITRL